MQYFIIDITYKASLDRIAEVVGDHRTHLGKAYDKGWFIASGPKIPKDGGLIIGRAPDRESLIEFLDQDPFYTTGVAEYRLIEFDPVKQHPEFGGFFGDAS